MVQDDGSVGSNDRSQGNQQTTVPPPVSNKYLLKQHKSPLLSTSSRLRDSHSNDNSDLPADINFLPYRMPYPNPKKHQLPHMKQQQSKNARNIGKLKSGSPKIEIVQ